MAGKELFFDEDELIVSKTDGKGRITYANRVFLRLAGYNEAEVIGAPHNLIRHPEMPRGVFKMLWDTIGRGNEIFAYVINKSRQDDYYWVFAHVTPTFDKNGNIVSYHSSRRCPSRKALETIVPIYDEMLKIEHSHNERKTGMAESSAMLGDKLKGLGMGYDEFIFALQR